MGIFPLLANETACFPSFSQLLPSTPPLPPHTRGSVSSHSSLSLGKSQHEEVPGKLAALSAASPCSPALPHAVPSQPQVHR